jgi:hypothetical protein
MCLCELKHASMRRMELVARMIGEAKKKIYE